MEPLITNDRGRREWAWIVAQVGEEAARSVQLTGNRKPYPLNIAQALGLTLPADLEEADRATARKRVAALRVMLRIGYEA